MGSNPGEYSPDSLVCIKEKSNFSYPGRQDSYQSMLWGKNRGALLNATKSLQREGAEVVSKNFKTYTSSNEPRLLAIWISNDCSVL